MSCFSCIIRRRNDDSEIKDDARIPSSSSRSFDSSATRRKNSHSDTGVSNADESLKGKPRDVVAAAKSFTFRELASSTKNFSATNLIGEGGFGKVYKGILPSGQIVAIKQLNLDGRQGFQEFIVEVLMLSLLHHPHLVTLIGYCTDGDQRLLVYDYMSKGSLEDHLFDLEPDKEPLDWSTRIKIAVGAARGIEYLHCRAKPPVIYRDLKPANILLGDDFNPKLSDFGLAKLGPVGDNTHVSTRVMGTYGYAAPEYVMSGKLTLKSDIYSFGVVLLELITGRRAVDYRKKQGDQNLVAWSRPYLKDKSKFSELADPVLQGGFSVRHLHHVTAIAAMCLQEQPTFRPLISDIVLALEYVASQPSSKVCKSSGGVHTSPRQSPSSPNNHRLVDPARTLSDSGADCGYTTEVG